MTTYEYLEAEPTWEIAHLFSNQGEWGEEEYLALETNYLVEYSHGNLEMLDTPTRAHQRIVAYLYKLLIEFILTHKLPGEVLFVPMQVQLWPGKYREPDILFLLDIDD